MANVPFFNFAASIHNDSEDESPIALNDSSKSAIELDQLKGIFSADEPQENPKCFMMDEIRKIFQTQELGAEDKELRYQKGQPVPLLPNPISQTTYVKYQQNSRPYHYPGNMYVEKSPATPNNYSQPLNYLKLLSTQNTLKPSAPMLYPKTSAPTQLYNIQVNEDVYLVERIEPVLHQISDNHDPFCPFCLKYIDLKKSNFQNISAYFSKANKKHYLTHFDCYYKFKDRVPSMKSLAEVPVTKANYQEQSIDASQFMRKDRKLYFMSFEALHPISSHLHFKIEKSEFALEETQQHQQGKRILYFDFEKRSTSIYEPNAYVMVYPEFRCQITVGSCPSNEEPYTFEFLVNASSMNVTHDCPEKRVEFVYNHDGNQIFLGCQAFLDIDNRITNSLNYRVPMPQRSHQQEHSRIMILRYIILTLPLYRKNKLHEPLRIDLKSIQDEESYFLPTPTTKSASQLSQLSQPFFSPIHSNFKECDTFKTESVNVGSESKNLNDPGTFVRKDIKSHSVMNPKFTFDMSRYNAKYNQEFNNPTCGSIFLSKTSDIGMNFRNHFLDDSVNSTMGKSLLPAHYKSEELRAYESGFKLSDYQGRLHELSSSPSGSQLIQMFIANANGSELDTIIKELSPHIAEVLLDPHANYMFQNLLQAASPKQRYALLLNVVKLIPDLAKHKKGTHSLQGILSALQGNEEEEIFQELGDCIAELSKDPYGTHFVQKLINSLSLSRLSFVFEAVREDFLELATDSYGLCVLKALITRFEDDEEKKKILISLLAHNVDHLIQNPFGNYAIQHAFETYRHDCGPICEEILLKISQYANQKFSSNVVEKCLETASLENKNKLIEGIITSDKLIELMTNKYGNFVLVKAYNLSDETEKKNLQASLKKHFVKIHSNKYRTRWTAFFEECARRTPEISAKVLNKQTKVNRERAPDELRMKVTGVFEEFEEEQDFNGTKFLGRKKSKLPTQLMTRVEQESMTDLRSKNRKYSAPLNVPLMKFTANFP